MGYYASYGGCIRCKETLPEEVINEFDKHFENVHYDNNTKELTMDGYDKFYSDSVDELLEKIKPFCESGQIEYNGEDNTFWRFVFINNEWIEYDGVVVYGDQLQVAKYNKEEFLGMIIDVMQDCLDNPKGETIEGQWYDDIKDKLTDIMKHWKVFE